jgi:alanine racemase
VRADVIPMVSSRAQWDALAAAAAGAPLPARAFLKVDTGMGRSGCLPDEATVLWNLAARPPRGNVHFTGIATHFSSAEEPDPAPTEAQLHRFHAFLRSLGRLDAGGGGDDGRGGRQGLWLSWANSPAVFRFPAPPVPPLPGVRGYLARAGLALYGVEPFPGAFAQDDGTVKPALSWHARVTLLRDLPAGATVGYGRTFTLARPSRIATLAVGYADGLSRRLSNRGHVLLGGGARCPIVGRISMDQCQVDVTDAPTPVQLGNVATLIGSVGAASQRVVDLAALLDTTPHEPLCAISHRVARRYHSDGGS